MPNKICILGSMNMDVSVYVRDLPKTGQTIAAYDRKYSPGGKGFNQAVAAARAGSAVSFAGCVGQDEAGRLLLDIAAKENIDISNVARTLHAPTGEAFIAIQEDGSNFIIINHGANAMAGEGHVEAVGNADIALSQFEVSEDAIIRFFNIARSQGRLTILNPAPARTASPELISLTDIIIPNETEMASLTGCGCDSEESLKKGCCILLEQGVQAVIVTLGEQGAFIAACGAFTHIPAVSVKAVDTTAAGDTFIGVFASSVDTSRITDMENLSKAVALANAAAALTVMKKGAYDSIPSAPEMTKLISL